MICISVSFIRHLLSILTWPKMQCIYYIFCLEKLLRRETKVVVEFFLSLFSFYKERFFDLDLLFIFFFFGHCLLFFFVFLLTFTTFSVFCYFLICGSNLSFWYFDVMIFLANLEVITVYLHLNSFGKLIIACIKTL